MLSPKISCKSPVRRNCKEDTNGNHRSIRNQKQMLPDGCAADAARHHAAQHRLPTAQRGSDGAVLQPVLTKRAECLRPCFCPARRHGVSDTAMDCTGMALSRSMNQLIKMGYCMINIIEALATKNKCYQLHYSTLHGIIICQNMINSK